MALLEKIFVTNGKLGKFRNSRIGSRSREAELEQVRLLLYKECDRRGRRVLFDSSTIEKLPANKNDTPDYGENKKLPCIVEVVDGFTYLYKGAASDAGVLGEMIFGAVAMNCKSVSLKIHIMDDPKRLMCTKMFFVPTSRRLSRGERKTDINANLTGELRNCSSPLNVAMASEEGVSLSFSIDRGDSGFYSDHSYSTIGSNVDFFSMLDAWDGNTQTEYSFTSSPSRKLSSSSSGSWQRRTFQSMATRFDLTSTSLRVPTVATVSSNDSQMYSNSVTSGTSESLASSSSVASRRSKLGLALLITVAETADMDVIRRCVEHSNQLQSLVCRLRLATLRAGAEGKFVSTLHKATEDAARWLSDLMFGARLEPVWLSLVTSEPRHTKKIAESLLSDLCSIISVGDTKGTNLSSQTQPHPVSNDVIEYNISSKSAFKLESSLEDHSGIRVLEVLKEEGLCVDFISTLLTHVLTYHLGWVTTVSPYDTVDPTKFQEKQDSGRTYNALWAQLGDLCGSIGYPPRTSRTIVAGSTNRQFINRLLSVLTYFMRCGDVKRNDFVYQDCDQRQSKVTCVKKSEQGCMQSLEVCSGQNISGSDSTLCSKDNITVICNNPVSSESNKTLSAVDGGLRKSTTVTNLSQKLSNPEYALDSSSRLSETSRGNQMRRNPSIMISLRDSPDSSQNSSASEQCESDNKVLFVLGDDEKLVGLKNKSSGGKSVKNSSKVQNEPLTSEPQRPVTEEQKKDCSENCDRDQFNGNSSTKCCNQTLQHSKPIKHSGFKFEFDKYPQIVTNYMKSKNLEILDRHYIGKPGNLKLDNFQFDPTVVPQIQEETCETCYKCQMMESLLQTPTNASELEYMNDMPRQVEPQYAKETTVNEPEKHRELSPKTFVRKRKENTVIINAKKNEARRKGKENILDSIKKKETVDVRQVIEFPLPAISIETALQVRSGFDVSLLGGITDHYVPDLILQGTLSSPKVWEADLKRDLDLTLYLNKTLDSPMQAVAIIGDTNTWEVRVVGRQCGSGGLSPLVGGVLDALPAMRHARVPAHQCLLFLESKLREFCVLSKTLAEMLMSTDFCDITTLTKSLNIDVNDVPLLLAVATTHTPQVAARYGISYR